MLALEYDNDEGEADLAHSGGALLDTGFDLETAVLLSLHLDAQAPDGYVLPEGTPRRGWWADAFDDDEAGEQGSLLWLREDQVCDEATASKSRDDVKAALKWMVDDGHVLDAYGVTTVGDEAILLIPTVVQKDGRVVTFPAISIGDN